MVASQKPQKVTWSIMDCRKRDFALIATHAKLGTFFSGAGKSFCPPMKGMTKRAFSCHLSKAVNLPIRIKGLASNNEVEKWLYLTFKINDVIK